MTDIRQIIQCIGNTPLLRLNRLSDETGCEILGKAEFMNPGGSVKDRAALGMIQDAKASGALRPGGTIVEGTAGNTGIGLAMVGSALGHRTVIVMPENQSREKIATLLAFGADVKLIPPVPYKNPAHFVHTSGRLAEALNASEEHGAFWANQFENLSNRAIHERTTGPEIWEQTGGKVDGFVCAVGTGGTLAGVARALRARNPHVTIALSDPGGSGLHNFFAHGEIKIEGSSISEGIGNSRVTANLDGTAIDVSWQIPDSEAMPIVFELIQSEGLVLGGSSGINLAGAVRLALILGRGHTIVTMLCDSALRYQERLFNRDFLQSKGLRLPDWFDDTVLDRRPA
jgi:cysteine synthase A